MSRADDRIRVPSNGHQPPLAMGPGQAGDDVPVTPAAERRGLASQATPTQLAVGFGIIASLILLALGARRRRG